MRCSFMDATSAMRTVEATTLVARCARNARYSVVAGSPPLNVFITAAIPDAMNISAASAARVVMRSTSAASSLSNLDST